MTNERERNQPDHPAADLETPAGIVSDSDDITPISARRKEMLERMARQGDPGPMTPEEAAQEAPGNLQSYQEDVVLREALEDDDGAP